MTSEQKESVGGCKCVKEADNTKKENKQEGRICEIGASCKPFVSEDNQSKIESSLTPVPYTFRVPIPIADYQTVEEAKSPPFYLQFDHTIAVLWCLFSNDKTKEDELGVGELQWALYFLKGIKPPNGGDRAEDVTIAIQAVEDALMERYADMFDIVKQSNGSINSSSTSSSFKYPSNVSSKSSPITDCEKNKCRGFSVQTSQELVKTDSDSETKNSRKTEEKSISTKSSSKILAQSTSSNESKKQTYNKNKCLECSIKISQKLVQEDSGGEFKNIKKTEEKSISPISSSKTLVQSTSSTESNKSKCLECSIQTSQELEQKDSGSETNSRNSEEKSISSKGCYKASCQSFSSIQSKKLTFNENKCLECSVQTSQELEQKDSGSETKKLRNTEEKSFSPKLNSKTSPQSISSIQNKKLICNKNKCLKCNVQTSQKLVQKDSGNETRNSRKTEEKCISSKTSSKTSALSTSGIESKIPTFTTISISKKLVNAENGKSDNKSPKKVQTVEGTTAREIEDLKRAAAKYSNFSTNQQCYGICNENISFDNNDLIEQWRKEQLQKVESELRKLRALESALGLQSEVTEVTIDQNRKNTQNLETIQNLDNSKTLETLAQSENIESLEKTENTEKSENSKKVSENSRKMSDNSRKIPEKGKSGTPRKLVNSGKPVNKLEKTGKSEKLKYTGRPEISNKSEKVKNLDKTENSEKIENKENSEIKENEGNTEKIENVEKSENAGTSEKKEKAGKSEISGKLTVKVVKKLTTKSKAAGDLKNKNN